MGDLDIVGIGVGPANLSLAALATRVPSLNAAFCERRPTFAWHPGLLLPDATIQVSFIKDLVTLADPTSPYSFLAFLFQTKRLYQFVTAEFSRVSRIEFEQYMRWVCAGLDSLRFGHSVESVTFDGSLFVVEGDDFTLRTQHIVLGTGRTPSIPRWAWPHLGPTVFHAVEYLDHPIDTRDKRVAVIGGGQTGAEIVAHLLSQSDRLPADLLWISRRGNFLPLDESPFTNEFFTPSYSEHFYRLPAEHRERLLMEQKLASDGICESLLRRIYQRLYELMFLRDGRTRCRLQPEREMVALERSQGGWAIDVRDARGGESRCEVDYVILCTGFEYRPPRFLRPLESRLSLCHDEFVVKEDFSIEWDGPATNRIYVQNAARACRGIADPNLSLLAWRSALIVNSIAGRQVYAVDTSSAVLEFLSRRSESEDSGDGGQRYAALHG